MKLYSVFDKKSGLYSIPFGAENDIIARRAFYRSATSSSDLSVFPEDFDLYCLGEFNTQSGALSPDFPVFVASGLEILGVVANEGEK